MKSEDASRNYENEFPLPQSTSTKEEGVEGSQHIIVLGANGSGKSRLGSWIEFDSPQKEHTHRISAQKSLEMPPSVRPRPLEEARKRLLFGREQIDPEELSPESLAQRIRVRRWNKSPITQTLNDYTQLMEYLFSEHSMQSEQYLKEARQAESDDKEIPPTPTTDLNTVISVWEKVFPRRELEKDESGKLKAYPAGKPDESYKASEMSDGERVAFYLIGECMAVPEDSVIVIDEPENHLHRSIRSDLWDAIEQERDDCRFVYLTHDLSFATTREGTRIWLKKYNKTEDGGEWDWEVVRDEPGIPEEVLLSILGSRKDVLFTEGEDRRSYDYRLYSHLYPEHMVVPCGGYEEVKSATRSFKNLKGLHELECFGLIDRDYRSDDTVESLKSKSVYVGQVCEVENLFLAEEVMRALAEHMEFRDVDECIQEAKELVVSDLREDRDRIISSIAGHKIRRQLTDFSSTHKNETELKSSFEEAVDVEVGEILEQAEQIVDTVLDEGGYADVLRIFKQRGDKTLDSVASIFDTAGAEKYKDLITRLVTQGHEELTDAMRQNVPTLSGGEQVSAVPASPSDVRHP